MGKMPFLTGVLAAGLVLSLCADPAQAQRYSRGSGTAAVIGFAAGAIAGAVLSSPPPPPPPRYIYHHHGYAPYAPVYYGYPPPMVQREIIYRDRPTPVIIQQAPVTSTQYMQAAPQREVPPPPMAAPSGPTFAPTPATPQAANFGPGKPAPGTLVDRLPTMARRVDRGGVIYFEEEGVHYLPVNIGNQPKFVVVQVQ